jgi:hypothetical protein
MYFVHDQFILHITLWIYLKCYSTRYRHKTTESIVKLHGLQYVMMDTVLCVLCRSTMMDAMIDKAKEHNIILEIIFVECGFYILQLL